MLGVAEFIKKQSHQTTLSAATLLSNLQPELSIRYGTITPTTWEFLNNEFERSFNSIVPIFGSDISNWSRKKFLDLGCGNCCERDCPGAYPRAYEPWTCRVLSLIGVQAYGIDLGPFDNENFCALVRDLTRHDVLSDFNDGFFDIVHSRMFANSPSLYHHNNAKKEQFFMSRVHKNLWNECIRLTKDKESLVLLDWPNN